MTRWTTTKPQKRGWYWWRRFAVTTGKLTGKEVVLIDADGWVNGVGDYVSHLGGEWAGPLEEPEEP